MNITVSMLMPGVVFSDFIAQVRGLYTATGTAETVSDNGSVALLISDQLQISSL
jgi:hypothetical protein